MRISDWSSDVCSSDLARHRASPRAAGGGGRRVCRSVAGSCRWLVCRHVASPGCTLRPGFDLHQRPEFRIDRLAGAEDARAHRADRAINALCDLLVAQALDLAKGDRGAQFLGQRRSVEPPSELQSLMRISLAVFCWKTK